MRIALITESFPPDLNGVANSVIRIAEHLVNRGHDPLVIAPEPAATSRAVTGAVPCPVIRVPALPVPGYRAVRLGVPTSRVAVALRAHRTDVVHLASPCVLGAWGMSIARSLRLPTVAVYQTDLPAYTQMYPGLRWGERAMWRWLCHIHNQADRTLAPSTQTAAALHAHGIERVWLWRRGVDTVLFRPDHRCDEVRQALAPAGETIVGYVGRLAPEKRLDLLVPLAKQPGFRLVIVGDGPSRARLHRMMPGALFLGARRGRQLARVYASLDVFVHPGPHETFGQTIQEAQASGLPVVAPDCGGPADLIAHDRTGLLVPPGDAHAITRAVASLATARDRRARLGVAARAAVADRSWARIGDELIEHYHAVRSDDHLHELTPVTS
ncbi:MAG: glycosyltransferase family 1 protein [Micromonosporaceae bacterium]|nr:glycosyltransferase family 1 protein [Micromonosporaceae bacterium]